MAHARSARIAAELSAQKEEQEEIRLATMRAEEKRVKAIEKKAEAAVMEMERSKQISRDYMNERGEEWQKRYEMQHEMNEDNKKAIHERYDRERLQQTRGGQGPTGEENDQRPGADKIQDGRQMWYHNGGGAHVDILDGASATQHRRRTGQSTNRNFTGGTCVSMGAHRDPWLCPQQTTNTPILYDGGRGMANQDSCSIYHEDGALSNVLSTFADRDWIRLMRLGKCGYRITSFRTDRPKFCDG